MGSYIRLVTGALSLFQTVADMYAAWRAKKAAVTEIKAEIAQKEVKAANATAEVLGEYRPDDDGARRLREGDF